MWSPQYQLSMGISLGYISLADIVIFVIGICLGLFVMAGAWRSAGCDLVRGVYSSHSLFAATRSAMWLPH